MSHKETGQDERTLEHLLGVVIDSREQRCAEVRDRANDKAKEIISQAYTRSRARLNRHVNALRDKYRVRVASAAARNQTQLRKQHQKRDRVMLDEAWPMLRQAILDRWHEQESRTRWLEAALDRASAMLLARSWHIEYPADLDAREVETLRQYVASINREESMIDVRLDARDDIVAGIRISSDGTVVDATVEGLMRQKQLIEAEMITRVRQREREDG